jgi:ABC-type Fe3+ transport system substrate-binding protein
MWLRFLAVALLAAITPAAAQDWPAERARLIEAAEKEGTLVVFALPNPLTREFVLKEWARQFPKIQLAATVLEQNAFIARLRVERSAEKYLWDVAFSGHPAGYVLAKEGALDPLLPELIDPDVNKPELWGGWEEAFVDEAQKYVFSMSAYLASGSYNASHVPPEKVERIGPRIILEPEYKGKIAWHDPLSPGAGKTQGFFVHRALGDDGLKTLILEQKVLIVAQQHQVVEAVARGTAWFGLGPPVKMLMAPYVQAGVKIDVRTFGREPGRAVLTHGGQTLYVFNKRPHPNATRLFLNWILTKDIQARLAEVTAQGTRRRDVPQFSDTELTPIPGAKYDAPQREAYQARLDATADMVRELLKQVK